MNVVFLSFVNFRPSACAGRVYNVVKKYRVQFGQSLMIEFGNMFKAAHFQSVYIRLTLVHVFAKIEFARLIVHIFRFS